MVLRIFYLLVLCLGAANCIFAQQQPERLQLVTANDLGTYVDEVNKLGKLKYKVSKAFNYGGDAANGQTFAAVMKLDDESAFEYELFASPNKGFLEAGLNAAADKGFSVVEILPLTSCSESKGDGKITVHAVPELLRRLTKGDVFLLERRVGVVKRSREYNVVTAKLGPGKSPTTEIQTALDAVPAGFVPFKILFDKSGTFDFSVSVLLERDLNDPAEERVQYAFLKEVNGFEKKIEELTRQGFQLMAGRRIGLIKFALMAKVPGDSASYQLVEGEKYEKEYPKKVTVGFRYEGMFLGDTSCDEPKAVNAKLVFGRTRTGRTFDHKFIKLGGDPREEIYALLRAGYHIGDIFYAKGPTMILEKSAP